MNFARFWAFFAHILCANFSDSKFCVCYFVSFSISSRRACRLLWYGFSPDAHSYMKQEAWVRWESTSCSSTFGISNGTRQGSVAIPAFWCIYLDPLFAELRASGVGCHMAGLFMGVVGYAYNLLLLAPSRNTAQVMLRTCEQFTGVNNVQISTDPDPTWSRSEAIYIIRKMLEYVDIFNTTSIIKFVIKVNARTGRACPSPVSPWKTYFLRNYS